MLNQKNQSFFNDGYLHLTSFIQEKERIKLMLRMRELYFNKCPKEHDQIFEAGVHRQSKDEYFLASANKISFFFDKNRESKFGNSFSALNKVGHGLHDLCPVFHKFSHQEKFYSLMRELGHKKPTPIQSMFIFKQSKFGDAVPAHQDATFLYTKPNSVIGLWVALEDANLENGCLWVIPKGHKSKLKHVFVKNNDHMSFQEEQKVFWPRESFVPLVAKAGDVIVLHGLLPHLSEQNTSHKTRFAYTLHFIDRACHFPKTNWINKELAQ